MKIRAVSGAVALTALFTLGSAAIAADQGATGSTSGPAAGTTVKPQTMQGGAAGVAGPTGSKNGPSPDTKTVQHGTATDAAGVPGAPGSKSGPAQRSGAAEKKK